MRDEATTQDVAADAAPLTLLIVDDSVLMRTMLRRVTELVESPITRVIEAPNGQAALRILETQHVDAVFTDINMPVMSGPELLREIARRGEWPRLTRIVVSTDGSEARQAEALNLNVHHYIQKPLNLEVMRHVLDSIGARAR